MNSIDEWISIFNIYNDLIFFFSVFLLILYNNYIGQIYILHSVMINNMLN